MPANTRLLNRLDCPLPMAEDTPPSTRPSSSASNNSGSTSGSSVGGLTPPNRSTSMDSINAEKDAKPTVEIIPTRTTRIEPKVHTDVGRFIKVGPANLHLSAKHQLEKVSAIKAIRKPSVNEEEEWQTNLDKWKSSRRKMNEEAIERVIRVKENEQMGSQPHRRKSMTLRGKINVHDDDNNDISDLLTPSPVIETIAPALHHDPPPHVKYFDSDAKDTKSDAGFCTGSDTGSDGVFAEDSISDTSSALGDKKDSFLDTTLRDSETNDFAYKSTLKSKSTTIYDKAIEDYKQFAENSIKKRTSSITLDEDKKDDSISDDHKPALGEKISDKLNFFHSEMTKESTPKYASAKRRTPQIELDKRRSMFELRDIDNMDKKSQSHRKSIDVNSSLKNKVASFENIFDSVKVKSISAPRDLKFKEKLANFSTTVQMDYSVGSRKAFPTRDKNFIEKLQAFNQMETQPGKSPERKSPISSVLSRTTPLKDRIASFERSPEQLNLTDSDRSVSMECLSIEKRRSSSSLSSTLNYLKKSPSTPFMVVEVDSVEEEKTRVEENIARVSSKSSDNKRRTVYELIEKCEIVRETDCAPIYSIFKEPDCEEYQSSSSLLKKSASLSRDSYTLHQKTRSLDRNITDNFRNEDNLIQTPPPIDETPIATPSTTKELIEKDEILGFSSVPLLSPPLEPPPGIPEDDQDEEENSSLGESTKIEYGDDDIDEVIQDYEYLSSATTLETNNEIHIYEKASEMTTFMKSPPDVPITDPPLPVTENFYENIVDEDEPMYENIYEKVQEDSDNTSTLPPSSPDNHHYQTLEDIQTEVGSFTQQLPPKPNSTPIEVIDVTWTEDGMAPALPPSIPPPPPPPEDEEDLDDTHGADTPSNQSLSSTDIKKEIRKKMSDFLGTSPQQDEEITLQPPPDVNELLRQERQSERLILQKQTSNLSLSSKQEMDSHRPRYTWEDRMKADVSKPKDLDESSDNLDFHFKLEELEREMVKHDRDMLQRAGAAPNYESPNSTAPEIPPPEQYTKVDTESPVNGFDNQMQSKPPSQALPFQEFYTAPTFNTSSTTSYPEQLTGMNGVSFDSDIPTSTQRDIPSPETSPPELIPRKKKSPVAVPEDVSTASHNDDPYENTNYRYSNLNHSGASDDSSSSQSLSKQSLLALSAIPKPRLVDNDSWIMKRKADTGKKDYSKHWLIQEAEQRRIEQQERIARQKNAPLPSLPTASNPRPPQLPPPNNPSYQSHYQNVRSSFNSPTYTNNTSPVTSPSNGNNPLPASKQSSLHSQNSGSSSSLSNSWRKRAKTYDPIRDAAAAVAVNQQKPLPESIINTLTQRVNNKNKNITNGNRNYNSNSRPEDYHDYMNTENILPPFQKVAPPPPAITAAPQLPPENQSREEQRLLSVSGKKKCSHCGEELGRGAAMIIESLRLFYHIPCFKCCVCSIQLGNGTSGADVRVRNHKLHCHNCYSNDEGMKFSKV